MTEFLNPGVIMALCLSASGFVIYFHALVTA